MLKDFTNESGSPWTQSVPWKFQDLHKYKLDPE